MTERSHVEYVDFRPEARGAWLLIRRFEAAFGERINRIISRQDSVSLGLCDALSVESVSWIMGYHEDACDTFLELEDLLIEHEDIAAEQDNPSSAEVIHFPTTMSETVDNPMSTIDSEMLAKLSLVTRLR